MTSVHFSRLIMSGSCHYLCKHWIGVDERPDTMKTDEITSYKTVQNITWQISKKRQVSSYCKDINKPQNSIENSLEQLKRLIEKKRNLPPPLKNQLQRSFKSTQRFTEKRFTEFLKRPKKQTAEPKRTWSKYIDPKRKKKKKEKKTTCSISFLLERL